MSFLPGFNLKWVKLVIILLEDEHSLSFEVRGNNYCLRPSNYEWRRESGLEVVYGQWLLKTVNHRLWRDEAGILGSNEANYTSTSINLAQLRYYQQ